jgi:choline kinase
MSNVATRHVFPTKGKKYSILIPAAGMGTRMKSYGPKCLIPLNKTHTVLTRQLRIIEETLQNYEVILVGGFEFEKLQRTVPPSVKLIQNADYQDTNVGHSISLGIQKCNHDNILIIYGDLVFHKKALECSFDRQSKILTSDFMKDQEVGCTAQNNILEQIFYDLDNKWAQIAYLTGLEREMLVNAPQENNSYKFGFELINHIINHRGKFLVEQPLNFKAFDIDTSYDIPIAKKIR